MNELGKPILLIGHAGSGLMPRARELHAAVPPRVFDRYLPEADHIRRIAGFPPSEPMSPAFRAPHWTISDRGALGTLSKGWLWRPGEVSLAQGGSLLLDEAPEFRTSTLEGVAEAWRDGKVSLWSEGQSRCFPAVFRPILSTYRCLCKFPAERCKCPSGAARRWQSRIDEVCDLFPGIERIELQ